MTPRYNTRKRKLIKENRTFNECWTDKYFFISIHNKEMCLICHDSVAVFKEYNLKRHFNTRHKDAFSNLSASELKIKRKKWFRL